MKFLSYLLIIAGVGLSIARAQTPAPAHTDLCLSDKAAAEKIVPCTKAIEETHDLGKILFLLSRGRSYTQLKQYEAAEKDFSEALSIDPRHPQALYERGALYTFLKRYSQAIADFTALLTKYPDEPDGRYNRAFVYSEMGQDDDAIKDLDFLLKAHPEDAQAFNDRGGLHIRKGQLEKAIKDYDQAIKLAQDFNEAIYNRGRAYLLLSQKEKAAADFKRVLDIRKNNPYAALRLALCGDNSALAPALEALDKERWPVPLLLYFQDKISAEQVFQLAASLSKSAPDATAEAGYYLGEKALQKGDKQTALIYFARSQDSNARSVIEYYDAVFLQRKSQ